MPSSYEILRKHSVQKPSEEQNEISKSININAIKTIEYWLDERASNINKMTIKRDLKLCRNTKQFLLKS